MALLTDFPCFQRRLVAAVSARRDADYDDPDIPEVG
jgi:hypothetical protein